MDRSQDEVRIPCLDRRVSAQRSSRGAFTLIELTIVLLIVSIMAAVATPKYSQSLADFRLKSITQRIASDIRQARRLAQANSAPQTIEFDEVTNSYSLLGANDADHRPRVYRFLLGSTEYDCELLEANFGGTTNLTFNIFGRPASTGTILIKCGATSQTLTVDEVGQVSVL